MEGLGYLAAVPNSRSSPASVGMSTQKKILSLWASIGMISEAIAPPTPAWTGVGEPIEAALAMTVDCASVALEEDSSLYPLLCANIRGRKRVGFLGIQTPPFLCDRGVVSSFR